MSEIACSRQLNLQIGLFRYIDRVYSWVYMDESTYDSVNLIWPTLII
jgi:hypothetical protein